MIQVTKKVNKKENGFTLIELLVVISIISLLSSVVLSALNTTRDKARIAGGQQFSATVNHTIGDRLTGGWSFDECSGTTVADRSGNNNAGTVPATVIFSSSVTPFKTGCSLLFNGGSTSYVSATGPSYPDGVTSLWMNTTNIGAGQGLFGQNNGNFLNMWMPGDGRIRFETAGGNSFLSNKRLSANTWYHIVMTYDPVATSNKAKIYIDGVLDAQANPSYGGANIAGTLVIGAYGPGAYPFQGYIDDVRVYSSSLVASEVQRLFATEFPPHRIFAQI